MCAIGDEITLDYLKDESFEWLDNIRRNCVENGAWWDDEKHRPDIGGIYVKVIYKTGKWVLLNSGVYDYGKSCYVKNCNRYLFKFKDINWIESDLEKEVERQYKEFLVYAKKYELEKDFEDVTWAT